MYELGVKQTDCKSSLHCYLLIYLAAFCLLNMYDILSLCSFLTEADHFDIVLSATLELFYEERGLQL